MVCLAYSGDLWDANRQRRQYHHFGFALGWVRSYRLLFMWDETKISHFLWLSQGNCQFPPWIRAMNWDFRGRKWKAVSVGDDNVAQNRIGFLSKVFKVNGPFHHHLHHHHHTVNQTNRSSIACKVNDCFCMALKTRPLSLLHVNFSIGLPFKWLPRIIIRQF